MPMVLLFLCIISISINVILILNNIKLKAINAKLELENDHSIITSERIESIKEKIKKTSEIKLNKSATKKDVEDFYKSQLEDTKKDTE